MAYITTEEVKAIREALKKEFGKRFKFSVQRRDRGLAVAVSIMAGDADFSSLWGNKQPGDYGYGYTHLNHYYLTEERHGENAQVFQKIDEIIKTAPANAPGGRAWFDKSDSQSDYFHTAFYYDINVGKFDRPYVQKEAA